jgi:ABC-type sugar transport system ATPase subunit
VLRALGGLIPEGRGSVAIDGRPVQPRSPKRAARAGILYVTNDRKGEGLFLGQAIEHNLVVARLDLVSRLGVMLRRQVHRVARHLAELVGVDTRRLRLPVQNLSGGNQQKVLIGRTLERESAEVLLLDEPTRGVDVGGRADIHRLMRHAAEAGNVVVFASTELDEILELGDVVVTMFDGSVVSVRSRADADAGNVLADMTMSEAAYEGAAAPR